MFEFGFWLWVFGCWGGAILVLGLGWCAWCLDFVLVILRLFGHGVYILVLWLLDCRFWCDGWFWLDVAVVWRGFVDLLCYTF